MLVNKRPWKIEWGDCDPAGIVHFPRFLWFFDCCTGSLFEAAGLQKQAMLKELDFAGYPCVDVRARFMIPSRFGDEVMIESNIQEWRRSSFDVRHRLMRGEDLAVEGFETRVWTILDPADPDKLKSSPVPDHIRARFNV